jgi:hypothetical protein
MDYGDAALGRAPDRRRFLRDGLEQKYSTD